MTTISEQVRAAYAARLGEPAGDAQFAKDGMHISVLKYPPSPATGEVTVYVTAGVSDLLQPEFDSTHRLEFYLGLRPEADGVAESLAWLGIMPQYTGEAVAPGHTWRSGGPVIPGYDFTGFLVLQSGEPIVPPIVVDGVHVTALMVFPLFTDELDYFRDHGAGALWARMDEAQVLVWDPARVSTFHHAAG